MFFCIWFIFIGKIKPNTKKKNNCIGYDCISIGCEGDKCVAGYCIGENCKAGNCIGNKCKAGDCYGFNCKPGKCLDPKCVTGKCPQTNKNCTDGKSFRIHRPFYYKYTKHLPKHTILNPPLCKPSISIKDIRNGRAQDIGLQNMILNKDKKVVSYMDIFTDDKIVDNDVLNYAYPDFYKNSNCNICVKDKCESD
jgi:hypothetical protein